MKKISLKEINRLSIPAIVAVVIEPLISLTDIAVVGHLKTNSEQALAAVGIVGALFSTMVWVIASTKIATSALVSKYLGMNRLKSIEPLIPQVIVFNVLAGIVLIVIANIFSVFIFEQFFLTKSTVLEYCVHYFKIRSIGFTFTLVTITIFAIFRGLQNTSWAMTIGILTGLLNLILDVLFAFPLELGIIGVAYASVIAQGFMFALALIYFFQKTKFRFTFSFPLHHEIKNWTLISLHSLMRIIIMNFIILISNRYASSYGGSYIATQGILINLWLFSAFFIDGYATAGNAIAGRLLGNRNYLNIWRLGLDISKYSLFISIFIMFVYGIFYSQIGFIFTKEKAVLEHFMTSFWMVIIIQPLNAVAFALDGIYKGLGRTKTLRDILIIAAFMGFLPALIFFDYWGWKLKGLWISFIICMGIRSLGIFAVFKYDFSRYGKSIDKRQLAKLKKE